MRLNLNLPVAAYSFSCPFLIDCEILVSQIVPIQYLTPGETGCVMEVEGDSGLVRRLDEIGLRTGVAVRMVQPGHPCIVALDHQRLSFRGDEEAVVMVEVDRD